MNDGQGNGARAGLGIQALRQRATSVRDELALVLLSGVADIDNQSP